MLGFPIAKVEVQKEKSMVYHPEYNGIRLDIYAKDENNTYFNVEMQTTKEKNIGKRSRYYHSQIDMELLLASKNLVPYQMNFARRFKPIQAKYHKNRGIL